jgi:hypothetical protein
MTGTFRPEPEASAELEDAALWYEGQRPGLGLEFVQAVDLALEQIAGWPQIGRRVTGVPNDVPAQSPGKTLPIPRRVPTVGRYPANSGVCARQP